MIEYATPDPAEQLDDWSVEDAARACGLEPHETPKTPDAMTKPLSVTPTVGVSSPSPLSPAKKWTPFPTDELPEPAAGFVTGAAGAMGCDPAYVALPTLAVCASAIGMARTIQLCRTWAEPSILWTVGIGRSGVMKSPPMELAMRPLRDAEADAFRQHGEAVELYDRDLARWEVEYSAWKKRKNPTDDPPEKPTPPVCRRFTTSDCTVEALAAILSENSRGVLVARDELSGWLGAFDAYRSGKGGDAARWLELHRAGTLIVDRKTDGVTRIERAAASVTGTIQPGTMRRALSREHFESGLTARMLLAWPPAVRKRWRRPELEWSVEQAYRDRVRQLLDLAPAVNSHGEAEPIGLTLTDEADATWAEWYDRFADRQIAAVDDDTAAALSKAEGAAARLALVCQLVRDPDAGHIDEQSIRAGITLAEWFAGEAERVYDGLREDEAGSKQRQLVEWIEARGGDVTLREVTRGFRRYRQDQQQARDDLDEIAEDGGGEWYFPDGPGRPSARFRLKGGDSGDGDKTPDGDTVRRGFVMANGEMRGEA